MALIGAVLIAPSFVDWNGFRGLLASQLGAALDRQVTIAGDMDAALLPRPVFKAADIRIGDASSDELITIETLYANLAFIPLLSGHMQVRELVLFQPTVHIGEESAMPFSLFNGAEQEPQNAHDVNRQANDAPLDMAVDFIEIEDGKIEILGVTRDETLRITGVHSEISMTANEPIAVEGSLNIQDIPVRAEATFTPINSGRADGINISVQLIEADAAVKFIGSANRSQERDFRGDISASGNSSSALLATFGLLGSQTQIPATLLQPFSLSAKVRGTPENIATESLSIDIGGTGARGAIAWEGGAIPHLDVSIELAAVDIKTWQFASAIPLRQSPFMGGEEIFTRAYAAEITDKEFAIPQGLTASIQVRAPLMSYGEDVLREGILEASLSDGELTLEEIGVTLPGATRVRAFGFIKNDGEGPVFDGALELDTQNLRGALTWLGAVDEIDQVPRGRLSNASLHAAVQGNPSRISFGDIAGTLDTSRATGSAFIARGERVSYGVSLTIDTLNLDTYVPVLSDNGLRALFSDIGSGEQDKPDVYGVAPVLESLQYFANVDVDVRIAVNALTASNVPNGRVGLGLGLKGGVLNIRSASFDNIAGATIWFSGGIEGFGTTPQFRDFQFDLHADNLGRFARAFGFSVPPSTRGLSPVAFTGVIDGGLAQAHLATTARFGGMTVSGSGQGLSLDQNPQFELLIDASHSSYASFLRSVIGTWPVGEHDPGAITLTARLTQSDAFTNVEEIKLAVGAEGLTGRIAVNEIAGRKKVSATFNDIALVYDNLRPHDPAQRFLATTGSSSSQEQSSNVWSSAPLDWSFLTTWDGQVDLAGARLDIRGVDLRDFKATFSVENGVAEISAWDGYVFGGQGDVSLRVSTAPEPRLQGEISFVGGDFAAVARAINGGGSTGLKPDAGDVDFTGKFETTGAAPRTLIENLSGQGSLKLTAASAGSGVVAGLLGAVTAVSQIESIVPGGRNSGITIDAKLSADNGRINIDDGAVKSRSYGGAFTGTVDLPNWLIDMTGRLRLENLPRADAATQRTLPTSVPITVRGRLDLPNIILNPS